jgi:hypothetical protein
MIYFNLNKSKIISKGQEVTILDGKDNLEYLQLIKLLEKGQEVDLCFCLDCTRSVGNIHKVSQQDCINAIKDFIEKIIDLMKLKYNYSKFRLAIVGYRDICDGDEQFEILDFTEDVKKFRNKLKSLEAKGGGDECEDVLGG